MSKQIWTLRGINFSYYTTFVALVFLPLFFQEKGYSASQIGILTSIGPFVTIFAQPLWGYASDRYRTLKLIIFGLWGMTIVSSIGLFHAESYVVTLLFMLLLNMFMTSSLPLLDTLTIQSAQKASVSYGSIRLYGSIGFMLVALAAGSLLQLLGGIHGIPYLFWMLWILPVGLLFFLKDDKGSGGRISLLDVGSLFRNKQLMWFLVLVFVLMVPQKMSDSMLTLHLKDLGASETLSGWAWAIAGASEIPTFALLHRYLHKFHELALLGAVAICYTIRWVLYGFITDPLLITLLQALTAVTWAAFWIIAVQYVTRIVPEEMRSTGQSLLSMVLVGICGIAGGYAGGLIKDLFGGARMFQAGAVMTTVAVILFFATLLYYRKKTQVPAAVYR